MCVVDVWQVELQGLNIYGISSRAERYEMHVMITIQQNGLSQYRIDFNCYNVEYIVSIGATYCMCDQVSLIV